MNISISTNSFFLKKFNGQHIFYRRQATSISDPTTLQYSASLHLWKTKLLEGYSLSPYTLGKHICQGADGTEEMSIFLSDVVRGLNIFPLSCKVIKIIMEEGKGEIILPCYVINPEVNATLLKRNDKGKWEPASTNEPLLFRPEIGFYQDGKNSTNKFDPGSYKCVGVIFADNETIEDTM